MYFVYICIVEWKYQEFTYLNFSKTSKSYGDWHRILVLDNNLRDYVRNNLDVYDEIMIKGEIIYNKWHLENGNIASQSVVLAKRIQKMLQFPKHGKSNSKDRTSVEQ